MRFTTLFIAIIAFAGLPIASAEDSPKLLRALSGPSGTVVDSKFVFDETRTRFVFPQDKSLTVYFEWQSSPGSHALSAIWKKPDGGVASISPEMKMSISGTRLNAYWLFNLSPGLPNGVWTVEIRIDGQPAGSHFFEIAGMAEPKPEPPSVAPPKEEPKQPSLDEIFKTITPSLVWIRKIGRDWPSF